MLGKQVVYADPRYTSQKCSCCKATNKKSRKKGSYHCADCHFQLHADWNAAINIRDNYILSSTPKASEEPATVNWPPSRVGTLDVAFPNVSAQKLETSLQPCAVDN